MWLVDLASVLQWEPCHDTDAFLCPWQPYVVSDLVRIAVPAFQVI